MKIRRLRRAEELLRAYELDEKFQTDQIETYRQSIEFAEDNGNGGAEATGYIKTTRERIKVHEKNRREAQRQAEKQRRIIADMQTPKPEDTPAKRNAMEAGSKLADVTRKRAESRARLASLEQEGADLRAVEVDESALALLGVDSSGKANEAAHRSLTKKMEEERKTLRVLDRAVELAEVAAVQLRAAYAKEIEVTAAVKVHAHFQKHVLDPLVMAAKGLAELRDIYDELEAAGAKAPHPMLVMPGLSFAFRAPVPGTASIMENTSAFSQLLEQARALGYDTPEPIDDDLGFVTEDDRYRQSAIYSAGAADGAASTREELEPIRETARHAVAYATTVLGRFGLSRN